MTASNVDAKIVLLGNSFAGKTSIVERFLRNRFLGEENYQNTIGAAYGSKTIVVDGRRIVHGIWDTAGSERYEAMSRIYYRGAMGAILCFDLTDRSSFNRLRFWIGELQLHEKDCQLYICGTKYDLIAENPALRAVSTEAVKTLADDCLAPLFETSSKTGKDIDKLFRCIAIDMKRVIDEDEQMAEVVKVEAITQKAHCPCS